MAPVRAQNVNSERTKGFVVMGYQGIHFELESGEGPYLKTLMDLLRINPDERSKTIATVRQLSETYPNIMDFADNVALLQQDTAANNKETAVLLPAGPSVYTGEKLENALTHLTRGMEITVFTKGGGQHKGRFEEYGAKRLWLKGAAKKSFRLDDILAIDASKL
jgi:hypothetical protein